MSAFITLEDGRVLDRSNLATGGLLWLISQQVSKEHTTLKRWLADVSKRPAPFTDFDVRGFSPDDLMEFYAAARLAFERLLCAEPAAVDKGGSAAALATLLRMKESMDRGEPPSALSDHAEVKGFDGEQIDLSEIWDDADEGGNDLEQSRR